MGSEQVVAGWESVLSLLYPEVCQLCGDQRAGPGEGYVCGRCRARSDGVRRVVAPFCGKCGLPFEGAMEGGFVCGNCRDLDLAFDWARASVVVTPLIREVIHRYKYERARWFEPFLAELLVEGAGGILRAGDWDGIVPVPLHPLKRREREFNQAERLAAALGRATGLAVATGVVRRVTPTRSQALLERRARVQNVAHAFVAVDPPQIAGGRWVVVDDVFTTGATTSAVSRVLRDAGAVAVAVWTLARGT